jgi:hypothetical protein
MVSRRSRGFFLDIFGRDEDAGAFCGAAADASAKLVKLGQAEALGVFDDHHGGVGHVHAHLDHRGGYEDVHVWPRRKSSMTFLFRRCACVRAAGPGGTAGRSRCAGARIR